MVIVGVTTMEEELDPPGIQVYCEAPEALSVDEVFVPEAHRFAGDAVIVVGGTN